MATDYWEASAAENMKDFFSESVDARNLMKNSIPDYEEEQQLGTSSARAGSTPDAHVLKDTVQIKSKTSTRKYLQDDLPYTGFTGLSTETSSNYENEDQSLVIKKLKSELRFAKQQLELNEITHLSPKQAIERIFYGKKCSLENFRSIEEKRTLLDEAIALHDGNAITRVLYHLEETLTSRLFHYELLARPIAVEHYIAALSATKDHDKLFDIYSLLNKSEDAAYLKLKTAKKNMKNSSNAKHLENCYRSHFMNDDNLKFECTIINENLALYQYQKRIEEMDLVEEKTELFRKQFQGVLRPTDLIGSSLLTTLNYCATFHYNSKKGDIMNPQTIKDLGNVNESQYSWSLVRSQSALRNWNQVDGLIKPKRLIGMLGLGQPTIKVSSFLVLLDEQNASIQVMNKYCDLIPDLDQRVQLGSLYLCHESVINALAKLKDRESLLQYQQSVKLCDNEKALIHHFLSDSRIRWKT